MQYDAGGGPRRKRPKISYAENEAFLDEIVNQVAVHDRQTEASSVPGQRIYYCTRPHTAPR